MKPTTLLFMNNKGTTMAGIIPVVSAIDSDWSYPTHKSMLPIGVNNYLAVERAVAECAYAGCNSIWIICNDVIKERLHYHIGDFVEDPLSLKRDLYRRKILADKKRWTRMKEYTYICQIPVHYIPVPIRDVGLYNSLAWGALIAPVYVEHLANKISNYLRPQKYYVCWPYAYYDYKLFRWKKGENRSIVTVQNRPFFISYKGKTALDGLQLGFTFTSDEAARLKKLVKEKAINTSKNYVTIKKKSEMYTGLRFTLKDIFGPMNIGDNPYYYEIDEYYPLDTWEDYCKFLGEKGYNTKNPFILQRSSFLDELADN